MKKKFYITTAIDYVNAPPHIGHAYEKILADVIARWRTILEEDVFFLTGTDENALKNAQAAKELNMSIKDFVDKNSKKFYVLCKLLNLSNTDFIRTTEERHKKVAQLIFKKIYDKGDIYKRSYEGLYCQGCEAFLTEKELIDGKCIEHNKEPKLVKEENYFFKLSKYEKEILKLVSTKDFILPEGWRKEIINRIKSEGLKDISVSRPNMEWGINTPIDKEHKIYVWIDALSNYISALDYPNGIKYRKYWPADIHLIGKGINWFHSVIWPAILISAKIAPPKRILVHGYLTVNGKKISKSTGNIIDPVQLIKKYGVDTLRYALIKDIPFNQDGDFSETSLKLRNNNELADDLGNLISRTTALCNKFYPSGIKKQKDDSLFQKLSLDKINYYFNVFELHNALAEIWNFIREINKYINDKQPWKIEKNREVTLYNLLESIRIISLLVKPFIPETSQKINNSIGAESKSIKDIKFGIVDTYKVKKREILFKKLE